MIELPRDATVTVRAYDARGREVARLADGLKPAGVYRFALGGPGAQSLASGVSLRARHGGECGHDRDPHRAGGGAALVAVSRRSGPSRVIVARGRFRARRRSYLGGVNTNGAWKVVSPPLTGGNFQLRIWDSAHEAMRSDPSVLRTTVAS